MYRGYFTFMFILSATPEVVILLTEFHSGNVPGKVYKLLVHDGTFSELNLDDVSSPTGIGYDKANKRLYWVDFSTEKVRSSTLDGGDEQLVATIDSGK